MTEADFGLRFHHLGLAVPDTGAASVFLKAQGYREGAAVFDPLQVANLSMWLHAEAPDIELICPAVSGEGHVASILAVQPNVLVYHL